MNKFKRTLQTYLGVFLCLALCVICFPFSVSAGESETKLVRVGWYEGTYNTTGPNGQKSGYSYEYQQAVAARTGWTYEYVKASWAELLNMLERGEIDLMGGVSYTEERAASMLFSELPMGEDKYYLYADISNTDISAADLETLNGRRIGMLAEAASTTQFCEWEENHGLHTEHVDITGAEDVRQKLADHRIDGFVLNESPQWEQDNLSAITLIGDSYNYFVISRTRPDLKEELDKAMQAIEHDVPFYTDDLYRRYLSSNSLEILTDEEKIWLKEHGAIRIGYLKNDVGISLTDPEHNEPVGIINDYVDYASDCLGSQTLKFELAGFDSQELQLQALRDGRIDLIFHVNPNPYEAEQSGISLSKTVFTVNTAVLTSAENFDENAENTVAVSKGNLLSEWYLSFHYPQWKIIEYDSTAEVEKAVRSKEADCFIVKAGQSSKKLEDNRLHSVFLTKSADSTFAVSRNNTVLLSILNKTLKKEISSRLSSAFFVYENAPKKVTLLDYIEDNLLTVTTVFLGMLLLVVLVILYFLMQARKALQQAEAANAAKSNFLFNMSHDIRTPMNALLGYNELLKRELTDPKLREYQEKIEQSGNLLLSIINNVLDMARIEKGKVELDENYVKIQDIITEVYEVFEAEAEKKEIHLSLEYQIEHEHVVCDATKNKEIFLNLLSNAVKYTPSGGTVTLNVTELPCERKGYVRIQSEIVDTGIGMSREFLPSLFVAFARERNTTAGKVAGTGLGMPIVKKYIDMMGGSIEVESELGKGTRFNVILEYRMADRAYYEQKADTRSEVNEELIRGRHILLAEDNDLNAEIATVILEDMGLFVERVSDGIQCVAKMEQEPAGTYDLILMDIQMPNMDGYKATQAIRRFADQAKADIPIVAMTANAFEEDREKAFANGMNGHIAKPVDADKIKNMIVSVLK